MATESTPERMLRAIREAKDLHAFVCGETRDAPATDNHDQRLRDAGIQRGYAAALEAAERASRNLPHTVSCEQCEAGEHGDGAAWRLHRVDDHGAPASSLKRSDVVSLLAVARDAVAAVERVRALADYFRPGASVNEMTACWVADIDNALAGDAS